MSARVELWSEAEWARQVHVAERPWMELYLAPAARRPAGCVVILPGGGYGRRAAHEAEPVARSYNEAGLHAFVVHYRVAPARHPAPVQDAARALRILRSHATEWGVDAARVALLGFSAGGHLAGTLAVHHGAVFCEDEATLAGVSCRPDAVILCYPVVSGVSFVHEGSFRNLLGEDDLPEMRRMLSIERHVTAATPPLFLWHTWEDASVPVENALLLADAFRRAGVAVEMHVYEQGHHGLGLAPERPRVATWHGMSVDWLRQRGW